MKRERELRGGGRFETEERGKISEIERERGREKERVASEDYGFVIERLFIMKRRMRWNSASECDEEQD